MEGYTGDGPACTQGGPGVPRRLGRGLRSRGYLAGVYGSAASTIRDLSPSAGNPATGPDDVWIANWNGQTGVFGDPYVADTLWPNHQRIHQYQGGHHETYGGVTMNIDSNTVDGPVVGPGQRASPRSASAAAAAGRLGDDERRADDGQLAEQRVHGHPDRHRDAHDAPRQGSAGSRRGATSSS